ncbi:MAG: NifB/NifX family molybdenum-iron cluster-binding protein [Bacillota bacterium]
MKAEVNRDSMKLAICSQGRGLDSRVDSRFGRCSYFNIIDTESGELETLSNASIEASHGAGTAVTQALASAGVQAVCAEHIGPNAYSALSAAGIAMYRSNESETVTDVVSAFRAGKLAPHSGATN